MTATAVPALPPPEEVHRTLQSRTAEVEEQVRRVYAKTLQPRFPAGIALGAVGGFGRRDLFPASDVDLILLVEFEQQMEPARVALSTFLQTLWDSGLRPSHSVHTVTECVTEQENNTELTISLLDRRFLAGDPKMFEWLDQRFSAFLNRRGASIARQLARLTEARRSGHQNTVYHLEPNVKDAPGSLRDVNTVQWMAALQRTSAVDLSPAFDFMAAVRIRLHQAASRDQNVLSFDAQEELSADPAALMRDYFRHARAVDRAVQRTLETKDSGLLGRFHEWRSRLSTTEFTVSHDRVLLRGPAQVDRGLKLFEFVARHKLRLAPDTVDRIAGIAPHTTWADWKALLSAPHPGFGLRAMQDAGMLAAAIPEWRKIEFLVVRDFYHRYTVDEHTLVAIAALDPIADARFAGLFAEIENPELLRFALLMHDIGKGSGGDHVQESLRIAREVLQRLEAPGADRAAIEFLIARHLELSTMMTSRDVRDGATAKLLAARVGTVERLKQLTMLTYADTCAVNPQAMTPWRLEQLWQVYLLGYGELTRELYGERIHNQAPFLEGLPVRYLHTHSPEEIGRHVALAGELDAHAAAMEISHERGIYRLTLLARDRSGLFAAVAGAISSFGLSIVKAEAFSNAQHIVVDTFTFSDPHRTLELNPPEVERLRGIVRRVVEGRQEAAELLRGRPRPVLPSRAARLKPRVTLNGEASETATLIEIVAEDRPGLLHDLARVISAAGCDIEVVLIDTEAHRALDVFYVTMLGRKVDEALGERLKNDLIAAC